MSYFVASTKVVKVKSGHSLLCVLCWSGVPNNHCAGTCTCSVFLVFLFCGFVVCSGSRCFRRAFLTAASSIKILHLFPAKSSDVNKGLGCVCVCVSFG